MKHTLKHLLILGSLLLTLVAQPSWAISKEEAKHQGLIGETRQGYLAIVKQATPELKALINDINRKRKSAYEKSAAKSGVERSVFELRMGQRLQDRAPKGHYIQLDNGRWQKK